MFDYYTMKFSSDNFLDSQGILKKTIILARKENSAYFPLIELRITDRMTYFTDKQIDLVEALDFLEEFKSMIKPALVPPNMIEKSNGLEIRLFKEEFKKRCTKLLNEYAGLSRQR